MNYQKVWEDLKVYLEKRNKNRFLCITRGVSEEVGFTIKKMKELEGSIPVTKEDKQDNAARYDSTIGDFVLTDAYGKNPLLGEWHNPDNLTPEQVEVKDGWRLLLKSELNKERSYSNLIEGWDFSRKKWEPSFRGCDDDMTYRTKLPIGELDKKENQSVTKCNQLPNEVDKKPERRCEGCTYKDGYNCKHPILAEKDYSCWSGKTDPDKGKYIENDLINEVKVKDQKIIDLHNQVVADEVILDTLKRSLTQQTEYNLKLNKEFNTRIDALEEVRRGDQDLIRSLEKEVEVLQTTFDNLNRKCVKICTDGVIKTKEHHCGPTCDCGKVNKKPLHDILIDNLATECTEHQKEISDLKTGVERLEAEIETKDENYDDLYKELTMLRSEYSTIGRNLKSRIAMWDELKQITFLNDKWDAVKVREKMEQIESRHAMGNMEYDLKQTWDSVEVMGTKPKISEDHNESICPSCVVFNSHIYNLVSTPEDCYRYENKQELPTKHPPIDNDIKPCPQCIGSGKITFSNSKDIEPCPKCSPKHTTCEGCKDNFGECELGKDDFSCRTAKYTICDGCAHSPECIGMSIGKPIKPDHSCWTAPKEPKLDNPSPKHFKDHLCNNCNHFDKDCPISPTEIVTECKQHSMKTPAYGPQPSVKAKQDALQNALQKAFNPSPR